MKKFISSSREKRIFILSCLCVGLFIFYRAAYLPLSKANGELQDKILTLEKQLSKKQYPIAQNKPYNQEYSDAVNCFKQTKSDKDSLIEIPKELEDIAKTKQVQIKTSAALKSKTSPTNSNFSINISLTGTLINILEFLYSLQTCPHVYTVNEMVLEKGTDSDSSIQCRLALTKSLIK